MKKEYVANSIVSTVVIIDGRKKRIDFLERCDGKSYYITADEELQNAIENDYYFQKGVVKIAKVYSDAGKVTNNEVKEIKEVKADVTPVAVNAFTPAKVGIYADVKRCADAIAILRDKYGVTAPLNTKAKILEVAQSIEVEFPNL